MSTYQADETLGEALGIILGIILVILVIALVIYILTSLLLNSVHKKIYGKGTFMAWVPYCKTYLLGKLAVNKLVGIILLVASVLSGLIPSVQSSSEGSVSSGLGGLISLANIVLYIMVLIKNGKLKRGELSQEVAKEQCESMDFSKKEGISEPSSYVNAMPTNEEAPNPTPTNSKYCTNCGSPVVENSTFCTNCGQKL